MNFLQAMVHLAEGRKVRRKNWDSSYFMWVDGNSVKDTYGSVSEIQVNNLDDWEIYTQPPPKKEVYRWRFKSRNLINTNWHMETELMSKEDIEKKNKSLQYEILDGPFQVEI